MSDQDELEEAIKQLTQTQRLIEIKAEHLNQLRTVCSTSERDTRDMIREYETKLVRFFAKQLVVKHKWPSSDKIVNYPSLQLWLKIVGLSSTSIEAISKNVDSVEELLKKDEMEFSKILNSIQANPDEIRRIVNAVKNLNLYFEHLLSTESTGSSNGTSTNDLPHSSSTNAIDVNTLYWDSWDLTNEPVALDEFSLNQLNHSPSKRTTISCNSRTCNELTNASCGSTVTSSNIPTTKSSPLSPPQSASSRTCPWSPVFNSDESSGQFDVMNDRNTHPKPPTQQNSPPLTPLGDINSVNSCNSVNNSKRTSVAGSPRPSTPPAARRHQTKLLSEPFPLTKSRSHEEHLSNRIESYSSNNRVHDLISSSKAPSNVVTSSNSFNLIPQNVSNSISSPHTQRRRLATEPSNIGSSTSPIISPCRSPPPVSPDQSDSCFDDASNSNAITTPLPPSVSSSSFSTNTRPPHHASSSVTSSTSTGSYHSGSNNLKFNGNNAHNANTGTSSLANSVSNAANYNSQQGQGQQQQQSQQQQQQQLQQQQQSHQQQQQQQSQQQQQQPNAPRSPRTHGGMTHVIHHRFVTHYKITSFLCSLCEKPMYIGLRCKECKYLCHRDCQDKVPPSCGLPQGFLQVFRQTLNQDNNLPANAIASSTSSEIMSPGSVKSEYRGRDRNPGRSHHRRHHPSSPNVKSTLDGSSSVGSGSGSLSSSKPTINITPLFGNVDSSSNTSSCTSSTPSSPALLGSNSNAATPSSASHGRTFHFPDVSNGANMNYSTSPSGNSLTSTGNDPRVTSGSVSSDRSNNYNGGNVSKFIGDAVSKLRHTSNNVTHLTSHDGNRDVIETHKSNDSEKTMSIASGSTDSERTLAGRIDSQDSTISELDSDRNWPRQNSLTSKEWEIPFDELIIGDVIGTGRFGTVYRGQWHGAVAIKRFNMESGIDDKKYLESFRQEVATFRKTRHDNLVLFMGACMKPPQLAIVTSLCKGSTLYTHLHVKKNRFQPSRALIIAQQICQGMSYLHARDIIHKDLKTKNVFYENGKVVITDFGLFSVTKMCQGNRCVRVYPTIPC